MTHRFTIRSIMILVAAVALALGAIEWARTEPLRLAAAQAARQKAHEAKYEALSEQHEADAAFWQQRYIAFGEVDRRAFMAIDHWKNRLKVRDLGEIEARPGDEVVDWPHPDPADTFAIIRGRSEDWERRLHAHRAVTQECNRRMGYHQVQSGLSSSAAHSPIQQGVFRTDIAGPPPAVDLHPIEFRGENDLKPKSSQGRTVEPIPTIQIGL